VAIYHLNYKSGSRAGGQSGAAKVAYLTRSGKYEAGADQVLYVEHGNYPTYASSVEEFWKAADTHERVNGRLFVEVEVALPRELKLEEQKELAREMAEWLSYKMPTREADAASPGPLPYTLAVHRGHEGGNPHVHILLNERPTDGVQRTMEATFKRVNAAHPERGGAPKSVAFQRPEVVNEVRQEWEVRANAALERAGHEARIDHRSYAVQGVDREPGVHLGHRASAMERAGVQTERGDELRVIQERNREREYERLRVEFEQRMERGHQRAREMGFEERVPMQGVMTAKAEAGVDGRCCVMVANATTKHYALVELEHVRRVDVTQDKAGSPKLTWKPVAVGELVKDVKLEVVKEGEQVHVYQGLSAARERIQQMEKERAEQEEQARERERVRLIEEQRQQKEREAEQERGRLRLQEQERERQRVREERERMELQAVRQEVQRQREMLKKISMIEVGALDGKVMEVAEVHGHRVIALNNPASFQYAVVVDAQEQVARMQLNPETNKPEVVQEPSGRKLEVGDWVHYHSSTQTLCENFSQAHNDRMKLEREQKRESEKDKDRGWER